MASEALDHMSYGWVSLQEEMLSSKGKAQRSLVAPVTISSCAVWFNSEPKSETGGRQETANEEIKFLDHNLATLP